MEPSATNLMIQSAETKGEQAAQAEKGGGARSLLSSTKSETLTSYLGRGYCSAKGRETDSPDKLGLVELRAGADLLRVVSDLCRQRGRALTKFCDGREAIGEVD
jgi:hypothetical protein